MQSLAQSVGRAVADSAARATTLGENWLTWRIALAVVFVLGCGLFFFVFIAEYREIRKAGGLKLYVFDINSVNYGAIRGIWVSEIVACGVGICIIMRALIPSLVSELQIEAVVTLFGFVGLFRGINFFAFRSNLANANPAVIAANAVANDPSVQPVVTTNKVTGETTVSSIPSPASDAATASALKDAVKSAVPLAVPAPAPKTEERMVADD